MNPQPKMGPSTEMALDFARAMAAGDHARAHAMLSGSLQSSMTAAKLAADYARMVEYGEGPPDILQVMTTMEDWPDKRPGDTQWVYVAIANNTYSEAVTVVVAQEQARLAIRSIEWGRP
jgi:hypothetical protein